MAALSVLHSRYVTEALEESTQAGLQIVDRITICQYRNISGTKLRIKH